MHFICNLLDLGWFSTLRNKCSSLILKFFQKKEGIILKLWGQFLPRPSVTLVVIFGLESPTLKGKPSSSCHIRDDQ